MEQFFEERLTKLEAIAKSLNARTELVNATIANIEDRLLQMNIGMSVWLTDVDNLLDKSEPDEEGYVEGWQLGYVKVKDAWRIAARRRCMRQTQDGWRVTSCEDAWVPALLHLSLRVRTEALQHLVPLLDALLEKAQARAADVKNLAFRAAYGGSSQ